MSAADYTGKTAYYGKVASQYDEVRKDEPVWAHEQIFVQKWVTQFAAGSLILDIPCGTGRFVPVFTERRLQVRAGDISADMVAELQRRYPGTSVEASVMDAERLALPDDSVEAIISWRFLHLLPPGMVLPVLREFRRVCPGAILIEVLQVPRTLRTGMMRRVSASLRSWYRRLFPMKGGEPWAHITSYSHPEAKLLEWFSQAGLTVESKSDLDPNAPHAVMVFQLRRSERNA